ncbi:MAG: hypothetical protein JRJ85_15925 [Deltaproteobacteria bacterium]|nr:hypothetical protein [Deltaproteobacteria bacterium]
MANNVTVDIIQQDFNIDIKGAVVRAPSLEILSAWVTDGKFTTENNIDYVTEFDYAPGHLKVFYQGSRVRGGPDNDFIETGDKNFRFTRNGAEILPEDVLIDYIRKQ